MFRLLVVILLILLLVGALPGWGWHGFGYYPSGSVFLILLIVLIVALIEKGHL